MYDAMYLGYLLFSFLYVFFLHKFSRDFQQAENITKDQHHLLQCECWLKLKKGKILWLRLLAIYHMLR